MSDQNGGPRIWSRGDLLALVNVTLARGNGVTTSASDWATRLVQVMEVAERPLLAAGLEERPLPCPASESPSPRIWSRDDFMDAIRVRHSPGAVVTCAQEACDILALAERHARIVVPRPRDARGHFVKAPRLPAERQT